MNEFFPPFCSPCTPQTSSSSLRPATCRCLRMILHLHPSNHLHLNSTKTKELVVDLRRRKSDCAPISINGVTVDVVQDYKYLGVNLNNKLNWAKNTEAVYRKGQSRRWGSRLRAADANKISRIIRKAGCTVETLCPEQMSLYKCHPIFTVILCYLILLFYSVVFYFTLPPLYCNCCTVISLWINKA